VDPPSLTTLRLEPSRGFFGRMLSPRELWHFREVALQIAARDVKVRYRQTALGALWAILQPVGTMVVFTIFFGGLAGVPSNGGSYALFSLAALVPWTFFQNAVLLGSDSLVANAALVSKTYFPRIFIPAGVVVAGLVDLAIGVVILFVIVLAAGTTPSIGILVLPVLVSITAAAALGVSAGRYVVPFLSQLWLFATPVAYPASLIDEPWRTVSALNPMAGVVEGFRWAVLGTGDAPWALMAVSCTSALVLLVAGLAYFSRVERGFADIL
jgi:lipopolysaccharide transport system permease protein